MTAAPTRPALRYHGGKWRLAPWIIQHFPPHRVYVEPFGGGASVLLRKPRAYCEVYNDLDSDVVNVFRVLRDPAMAQRLRKQLVLTPFSRDEFEAAYTLTDEPVERARRTVVRAFMGFGSASTNPRHRTGFRSNSHRSRTTPAKDWQNWPGQIDAFVERLAGVVIENRNALQVLPQHDAPDTLIYADPPYVHSTRYERVADGGAAHCYTTELSDDDHRALAAALRGVQGMVVLSGYACTLYDQELYADWQRIEVKAFADGARERVEVLWLNPACAEALERTCAQPGLALHAAQA